MDLNKNLLKGALRAAGELGKTMVRMNEKKFGFCFIQDSINSRFKVHITKRQEPFDFLQGKRCNNMIWVHWALKIIWPYI